MSATKTDQSENYFGTIILGPRPLDPDRLVNPNCPYCDHVCIPFSFRRHKLHKRYGWMIGWTCNCQVIKDMEKNL